MTLSDASVKHPGAFTYDWRTRFGSAFDPPRTMGWTEATQLFFELLSDPSSHVAAALNGWDYPVSREWIALTNLFDLHRALNHDKKKGAFKQSDRPWPDPDKSKLGGNASQEDIRAALAARGH